jgi:RimJ/RimL family protein N-acetyltransferase
LADRAAEGVHEADYMPFSFPWTVGSPEVRAQRTVQYHFRKWGEFTPESWSVELVVVHDGQIVGTQGVMSREFLITREVTTGSWLGRRFQGKGIGTEMRRAVLHLAFAGLGAEHASTEAFEDNPASLGVTRKLGYREDGFAIQAREGKPVAMHRFRLSRADWTPSPDIELHNLTPCLPLFGLDT